jgi:phosphatidylethanolamine/phosphatidyl-N-methylethanolamine N-methyltransferase
MENKKLFLKHVFKNQKRTGAISASSPFLAKKMVKKANLKNAKTIIELGPGTGEITKFIIENKKQDSDLWTFDINQEFVEYLKKEFPSAKHVLADIHNLKSEMKKNNIESPDVVISGIPFSYYKKDDCQNMLQLISDIMHKNSRFILFTYSIIRLREFFSCFQKVGFDFVPLNIPPAYVLTLKKK